MIWNESSKIILKKKTAKIGLVRKAEPNDSQPDLDCRGNVEPGPRALKSSIPMLRAARAEYLSLIQRLSNIMLLKKVTKSN